MMFLTIEEYERDLRRSASDLQLVERIFHGGMASNELRAALWPYIFGLVKHRGRFRRLQPTASAKQNNNNHNHNYSNNSNHNSNHHHHHHHHQHSKQHINGNTINGNNTDCNPNSSVNGTPATTTPGYNHDGIYHDAAGGCTNGTPTTPTRVTSSTSTGRPPRAANSSQASGQWVYIEHERNVERWRELERLYLSYEAQWKSIMPDQELRFSTFRERKSLIERDVIRSDRSHPFYADSSTNLTNLTTLLMTYMMYDFDIGYLQGMSDIAAPILYVFQGDLVKSFWVFVEVMKLFRRNFEFSQKTIHFQLDCLYRLIKLTDPKLAQYLSDQECSNCFFAFRCIVCLFKRELMRSSSSSSSNNGSSTGLNSAASSSSSSSSASSSSSTASDSEDQTSSGTAAAAAEDNNNSFGVSGKSDDYAAVLNLWDTIWCVQRRHELQSKSKCVHTFTIANGSSSNNHHLHQHYHHHQHHSQHLKASRQCQPARSPSTNGLNVNKTHNTNDNHSSSSSATKCNGSSSPNGLAQKSSQFHKTQIANGRSSKTNGHSTTTNGHSTNAQALNGQQRRLSKELIHRQGSANSISSTTNGYSTTSATAPTTTTNNSLALRHRQQSITSIRSNGSIGSAMSMSGSNIGFQAQYRQLNGSSDRLSSALSLSPASINGLSSSDDLNGHSPCCKPTAPIKQEQIVYTKETFYSSFDPNQADVPRFELTETEKFMLSLCLSMIRTERNQILHSQMDASEIHQHFINPNLAGDMDNFIGQAYEIYNFLNTDCDLQRLVKGANQFNTDGPADLSPISGIDTNQSDVADTYDLLKDYLIISPTSYTDLPNNSLNNNNLIGSINYLGHKRSSSRCNVPHKSWDKFINTKSPV